MTDDPTVNERALRDEIRALRHQLAQCQDARALAEASRPQCPRCGVVT